MVPGMVEKQMTVFRAADRNERAAILAQQQALVDTQKTLLATQKVEMAAMVEAMVAKLVEPALKEHQASILVGGTAFSHLANTLVKILSS